MKIGIIGAGNVATHLGIALHEKGISISGFYSRKTKLSDSFLLKITESVDLDKLIEISDVIIFAVSDHAISEILDQRMWKAKLLLHTAGSVSMEVFSKYSPNFGVFYPLQTFSKNRELNYKEIPFLLEANTTQNLELISKLASKISDNIQFVNSIQRKNIHLAAVFVSNFTNHMLDIASEITNEQQLDFNMFNPLIKETFSKAIDLKPRRAQTGPALRKDLQTINKHLAMLSDKALWKKIYSFVSQSIFQIKNK